MNDIISDSDIPANTSNRVVFLTNGPGQTKTRGEIDAEPSGMALEAQPQFCVGDDGIEARISLRVRADPRDGDRPVIDVQEAEVDLSLVEARNLVGWLGREISRLERNSA
jgi:hypothetical protein